MPKNRKLLKNENASTNTRKIVRNYSRSALTAASQA